MFIQKSYQSAQLSSEHRKTLTLEIGWKNFQFHIFHFQSTLGILVAPFKQHSFAVFCLLRNLINIHNALYITIAFPGIRLVMPSIAFELGWQFGQIVFISRASFRCRIEYNSFEKLQQALIYTHTHTHWHKEMREKKASEFIHKCIYIKKSGINVDDESFEAMNASWNNLLALLTPTRAFEMRKT